MNMKTLNTKQEEYTEIFEQQKNVNVLMEKKEADAITDTT